MITGEIRILEELLVVQYLLMALAAAGVVYIRTCW